MTFKTASCDGGGGGGGGLAYYKEKIVVIRRHVTSNGLISIQPFFLQLHSRAAKTWNTSYKQCYALSELIVLLSCVREKAILCEPLAYILLHLNQFDLHPPYLVMKF